MRNLHPSGTCNIAYVQVMFWSALDELCHDLQNFRLKKLQISGRVT